MRDPDDPSLAGGLLYRLVHYPLRQWRTRNPEFWLYLLLRRVQAGPFAGMKYVGESNNPHIAPFLLGVNEREIWPFVRRLQNGGHDGLVNIGAAEGYYAVGFAHTTQIPRIVSFEGDRHGRVLTRLMARRNGVANRLDVRGACGPDDLQRALEPFQRPALLMDVEGYEETLADPARVPALSRTTMIIELHEHERPVADILRARFAATHAIEEVWTQPTTVADLPASLAPATWFFSRDRLLALAHENRAREMRWWLLSPRIHA